MARTRKQTTLSACLICLLVLPLLSACEGGGGSGGSDDDAPIEVAAADATGLRSTDGGTTVLLLAFMAIKSLEDRTILHFATDSLPDPVPAITLVMPYQNQGGSTTPSINVYTFAGDGTVSIDEWDLGNLVDNVPVPPVSGDSVVTLDVTGVVQAALDAADEFVSFNLRFGGNANLMFGSIGANPDPTLQYGP